MKHLLFILFLIPFFSVCQELPYKDGDIVYELSLENNHLSKEEIFNRTIDFVENTLKKGSVFIQTQDLVDGTILTIGKTAFNERNRSWVKYEFGFAVWSRFKMDFDISDGRSVIRIYSIEISKSSGAEEHYRKLTDDAAEGKLYLSRIKDGKLKNKRQKEFEQKAEDINNTFYTVLALYKRAINN
ncbi:DUF4468 domain-containing protein [Sphingobacterium hotanense]|uniref:DUF4468 domain-containing protein n=1 Tax=Sphingobacterium hotanense TaxID=649196 RepID=A0ABT7NQP0_9SPHI|nr:DUF4468 domain-containing protein [Sphingobacterium hotanense]MDM1049506.1 DUF4468 domain-containing protein [Sphingobacterium hotanense]